MNMPERELDVLSLEPCCNWCVLRMHFPSDIESIRGSQAFKVSITMISPLDVQSADPPVLIPNDTKNSRYQNSRCGSHINRKEVRESNFLTVSCLSCALFEFQMIAFVLSFLQWVSSNVSSNQWESNFPTVLVVWLLAARFTWCVSALILQPGKGSTINFQRGAEK